MDTNNYPTVENKTKLFLEKLQQSGGPPLYTLTPTEARNVPVWTSGRPDRKTSS